MAHFSTKRWLRKIESEQLNMEPMLGKFHVLVVDDDADNSTARVCLEMEGYNVALLQTQGALAAVGIVPPDVIIADVIMPSSTDISWPTHRQNRTRFFLLCCKPLDPHPEDVRLGSEVGALGS